TSARWVRRSPSCAMGSPHSARSARSSIRSAIRTTPRAPACSPPDPMAIRIEYFIDHLKVGGAQRHLVELFSGLDRSSFLPHVCVAEAGGALEPVLQGMGIPVRTFGVRSSLARPSTLSNLVRTARR